MNYKNFFIGIFLLLGAVSGFCDYLLPKTPIFHSHNDYEKAVPLFGALSEGADSIEVDLHLSDGKLYSGHALPDISGDKIFSCQYLEPLHKIFLEKGYIREQGVTLFLVVDIKSAAGPTWNAIEQELLNYKDMLTVFSPEGVRWNAVSVLISGFCPRHSVWKSSYHLAAVDGRPKDLGRVTELYKIPVVSGKWTFYFPFYRDGKLGKLYQRKLTRMVEKAHSAGQLIRFYATGEDEKIIKLLINADVDILNADNILKVKNFTGD